jgi:hypothetical protein
MTEFSPQFSRSLSKSSGQTASIDPTIKLPIGHLHFDDLGRTVRIGALGGQEGILTSATHGLRRDGSPETTLEVRTAKGSMSSTYPSPTICILVLTEQAACEKLSDVPTSPELVLHQLNFCAALEVAGRRG